MSNRCAQRRRTDAPPTKRNRIYRGCFLLSADKFLWKKARNALTIYSVNFKSLDITGITTEGYALFTAVKAVYHSSADISLHELCDVNLIDDSTMMTIFAGVMLFRDGIGLLNWRVCDDKIFY